MLGCGACFGRTNDFSDTCPESACCTELGNFFELLISGGKAEGQLLECLLRGETCSGEGTQVIHTGGECHADFLGISGALVG